MTGWSHLKSEGGPTNRQTVVILRWVDWCFAKLAYQSAPKCYLTGPDEQKENVRHSQPAVAIVVCLTGNGLAPAASFSLMRSTMRRLIYCWPACLVGGLSRLGRLGPGLQGAAGAAPSCPDLQRRLRWSNFLKPPPFLFIVLRPHPLSCLPLLAARNPFTSSLC